MSDPFAQLQAARNALAELEAVNRQATAALAESDGLGVQLADLAVDVRSALDALEAVAS